MDIGTKVIIHGKYKGEIFRKVDNSNYGYDFVCLTQEGKYFQMWHVNNEDLTQDVESDIIKAN